MGCGNSKATPASFEGTLAVDKNAQAGTDAQKVDAQKPEDLSSLRKIEITITKTPENSKIGLKGSMTGEYWKVTDVADGLVKVWNEAHPELTIEAGDKIVACNGVQGNGQSVVDAMKKDMELKLTIAKIASDAPETSAPPENAEATSTPTDNVQETTNNPMETVPENGAQDAPESGTQEPVEVDTTDAPGEAEPERSPRVKEPDQAANYNASNISMMEEQPMRENDITEPDRKPNGWMCCASK
jgi:hypothetical protein